MVFIVVDLINDVAKFFLAYDVFEIDLFTKPLKFVNLNGAWVVFVDGFKKLFEVMILLWLAHFDEDV